ncbi:MAG TPA: hypothetical protein VIJ82_12325 [Streptosporangiaceae bacterium]
MCGKGDGDGIGWPVGDGDAAGGDAASDDGVGTGAGERVSRPVTERVGGAAGLAGRPGPGWLLTAELDRMPAVIALATTTAARASRATRSRRRRPPMRMT